MVDKKTSETPEGTPRRKREAPTIDLTAKDVTSAEAAPSPAPADEASGYEAVSEALEEQANAMPPTGAPEPAAADATVDEASAYEEVAERAEHVTEPPSSTEQPAVAAASEAIEPEPKASVARQNWGALIAAGIAGGVIVTAALGAAWYGDLLTASRPATGDANAQLAVLQRQIQDLQNRAPPATDTKSVDALTQRVAKMEDALKTVPKSDSSVTDRLIAAENAMKSLGVALTALNQRNDDAAANAARAREQADAAEKAVTQLRGSVQDAAKDTSSAVTPAQIETLTQRLAALETASKTARAEIDKATASERATRLALSASSLRTAVIGGAPYIAELAQAKGFGANDKYLAPLAPFAASGVPSAALLAQELRALLPQMVKLAGASAPTGGFLERLQANASKLVKVTPVDAPAGDDASAVLARLEVESSKADLTAVLADLAKLPEPARAPAQGLIAKAKAREAALNAARDFATEAARALDKR